MVNCFKNTQKGDCLHSGFLRHAREHGDRIFLSPAGRPELALTYAEAEVRARRIASFLVKRGVRTGDAVAVRLPRGREQILAFLGVLMAGAAYVPVNVRHPEGRVRSILQKGIQHILTEDEGEFEADGKVSVHRISEALSFEGEADLPEEDPGRLAYIIFTSGSTGEPKGVMIRHEAAMNTVKDINERYSVNEEDALMNVSEADFDLSVYDIFGISTAGGRLVLLHEEERRDPAFWIRIIREEGIRLWNSVPALLEMLLMLSQPEDLKSLRLLLISGDRILRSLWERAAKLCPAARFVSLGGATEASIWSNVFECESWKEEWPLMPYGSALSNQSLTVVRADGRKCEAGEEGEIQIGGKGLMDGYYSDPVLSQKALITVNSELRYRT